MFRRFAMQKQSEAFVRMVTSGRLHRSIAFATTTSMEAESQTPHGSSAYQFCSNKARLVAALGALGLGLSSYQNDKTDCCGIAAVVGTSKTSKQETREYLLEGLTALKNRGYDSAGIATIAASGGKMSVTKFASDGDKADCIDLVRAHSEGSAGHGIGIAHTRWATHGAKTDINAHPHLDSSGKIALVHNGCLINAHELRRELRNKGHKFLGQTDSEVIAKLVGDIYENEKCSLKAATEKALAKCYGTWGLCIMCTDTPDELVVACNGSPLMVGLSQDRTFVASDVRAFSKYTKNFIPLKSGEISVLRADGLQTWDLSRARTAQDTETHETPDPYNHWVLKECYEQPEAIARALGYGGRLGTEKTNLGGLDANYDKVSKIRHMIISACGSSLYAAQYGTKLMKMLGSFDAVYAIDATDTDPEDFPELEQPDAAGLLVVSQSGETKSVADVVEMGVGKNLTVMSVVNAVGSLIATTTNMGVYTHAGPEHAVASTKTFTTQVTVLALIGLWFSEVRNKFERNHSHSLEAARLKEALMRLPVSFGSALKTREQCKKVAECLKDKESCFVLGKGFGEPIAREGAQKIKEMGYLHAEGYSGGALKHGPFALIESDESGKYGATPIIMIILDDNHAHHMRTAAEEVKARGAEVIIITDKAELARDLDDDPIVIPTNGPMTALVAVLPLQLIAYELAILRGIDPDTPRNLTKVSMVD